MGRVILILISLSLLSGCALFKPRIEYVPINAPISCDSITKPEPLKMLPVKWQIATDKDGKVVLALDGKQYSNLSVNMAEIKGYMKDQRSLTQYYENCIKRHNEKGPQ